MRSYRILVGLSLTSVCVIPACSNLIGLSGYSVAGSGGQPEVAGGRDDTGPTAKAGSAEAGSIEVGSAGETASAGGQGLSGAFGAGGRGDSAGGGGSGAGGGASGAGGSVSGAGGSVSGAGGSASGAGGSGSLICTIGCDDGSDCTVDSCVSGQCLHQRLGVGVACGGGRTCDAQGQCVRCRDTASGTAQDVGCPPTAPQCVGTGLDATCTGCTMAADCNDSNDCTNEECTGGQCVVTAVAAGQACSAGVCNGTSGAEKCLPCIDSAPGAGRDPGCTPAKPACDPSGNPTCYACVKDADCPTDNVTCTVETCSNHLCMHVATDSKCVASGDVCKPNRCDATLDCKTVDVSALVALISAASSNGNGSFEDGSKPATGWTEAGPFYITTDCATTACPASTMASLGKVLAWLGGALNAGIQDLSHLLPLPVGTTKLHVQADTNFQTASALATNHDLFQVRLLDAANTQIGTPLFAKSNMDAQTGGAHAWTSNGIDVTVDVAAYAGNDVFISFWASSDTSQISNFFLDNVRITATVCK